MVGLTWENIQTYMPEYLREVAVRLFNLGYEVNYRTVQPNPKRGRKSSREVIDAQNGDFIQLRLTITWSATQGPLLTLEGSVRDSEGEQLKLLRLDGMEGFWSFAENGGQCPCGGRVLSERSARAIVRRTRKERNGRDVDMYRCSAWTEFFHVTENSHPKVL